jgi:hypothetical protein
MELYLENKMNETIEKSECPKGFKCSTERFENLCKAEDVGMESYLHCLEERPLECTFSVGFFGDRYYCECPLRVYIAKKLKT